jgi:hypothetical protein
LEGNLVIWRFASKQQLTSPIIQNAWKVNTKYIVYPTSAPTFGGWRIGRRFQQFFKFIDHFIHNFKLMW